MTTFDLPAARREMADEVGHERGALPLLAFAASRLWEKRDRDTGLLTRQAYHDIGGVGGALGVDVEARGELREFPDDIAVDVLVVVDQVHLVHTDHQVPDVQQ